jgi:hypothetical protein
MAQQDDIGDLTQLRDPWLMWWQEHRIDMNRHREACIQSISECRAAIDAADAVLWGSLGQHSQDGVTSYPA